MNIRHMTAVFLTSAAAGLLPFVLSGQVEKRAADMLAEDAAALPGLRETSSKTMADHLGRVRTKKDPKRVSNAVRVARDANGKKEDAAFVHYAVPPMSENQYLPDAYPVDGQFMKDVKIIAAQDEYEPGSFVIYPLKDLGKVRLTLTDFKTKAGDVFPKEALDLKVVKVWYQNGNGWYSYFGDTGLKLTPELLLNDEDLVKVDTEKQENYARLREKDGTVTYRWLTPPHKYENRFDESYLVVDSFAPMKENFSDAAELQPVLLEEGSFKQFFLTAHAAENQKPGVYHGAVRAVLPNGSAAGEIPVTIRVLPFRLPAPKTYFDVNKDYLTGSYNYSSLDIIKWMNGGDNQRAKEQLLAVLKNLRSHNQMMHWLRGAVYSEEACFTMDLMKKAGLRTDVLIGGGVLRDANNPYALALAAAKMREWCDKHIGHHNIFLGHGDEPGAGWMMDNRPIFEAYQKEGFRFILAGGPNVLHKGAYIIDWFNSAKLPEERESTRAWNETGHSHVAWYAVHHVGPENPAFNRRQYGMAPYLANYSATCNYAHHFGSWNDRRTTYKPMVFAYGCGDGVIDTLQWEGYREGLDDIRYATLMKTLALEAEKHADIKVKYAGRQALQFLSLSDPATMDLASARLEMIRHILKLKEILGK